MSGHLSVGPGDESAQNRLLPSDYAWLALVCFALAVPALADGRCLTTHESTHCLNVREMFTSGQYLIPTYGGRPWLERPPVPHWLTGIPASLVADTATTWAMRVGSALAGLTAVLLFAWALAGCLGRVVGVLSGLVLATAREFAAYLVGPEADIFLAAAVTVAGALFLRAEFGPAVRPRSATFFGPRPGSLLGAYLVLGTTNAMKGPLFGTAFLAAPLAVYLLLSRDWGCLRRMVWFWGWLAYLAVGLVWPVLAYQWHPEVADVWMNDYGKRFNEGYLGEPWWYYVAHVPWNLFPWTVPALFGLWVTRHAVFRERHGAWPFLWAWALVPPVLFSVFQGKHHHYMLNVIAPWAALGAAGTIALWRVARDWPGWARSPLLGLIALGIPGAVGAVVFGRKIPGPSWVAYTAAVGWPVIVTGLWYFATRRSGRVAVAGVVSLIVAVHAAAYLHRTAYLDRYAGDREFLARVKDTVPADEPIYVLNEPHPLNASWLLYYLDPRARLLHNETFLASEQLQGPDLYVVARLGDQGVLASYGAATPLFTSSRTRGESAPADRYTLFRLRLFPDLVLYPPPPVNGMQATGRGPGPRLPGPERRP